MLEGGLQQPKRKEFGFKSGPEPGRYGEKELKDIIHKIRNYTKKLNIAQKPVQEQEKLEVYDDRILEFLQQAVFNAWGRRPKRIYQIEPIELASAIVLTVPIRDDIIALDETRIRVAAGFFCDRFSSPMQVELTPNDREEYVRDTLDYYKQMVIGLPSELTDFFGIKS
ncbi:hypothetical protein A3J20_05630 [Candidatus Gottesmanbacteria bacterium RIFCSPLOWO2_02_FULL_42_29]|uniref:Uncharacterized protein n=2 Tax=Candidatus Gottesmaniibacteriota TaxID=1752720 RepID=A0A1F6BAQ3_9BACT|nr:MAG: hypothetical protein UV09_C0010G0024 [Candidatus Gottesmanbacteria bacterium GW2011_GWA2_42_18]KKS74286.1 MAG: hypothetical protein UV46_C0047G0011 [Candidatus Gottesmanbacteria bacterium GW2011_GWC2_42_8]OGG09913.1 MAG: hypothetical protein A2781_04495 [Candidatus Gottesmanbacteria bacterium RIFCSPHIGHO2_01_FULL_42_27]OGG33990.1 MAG: hypothetical protein A2968_05805 [Candidatus Gottesmanbacteria bacterium RIFCSPLOWO2_01_FULL_42_22]OGG34449.1 MAG: hypothetical protein A3G68_04555 [Candi